MPPTSTVAPGVEARGIDRPDRGDDRDRRPGPHGEQHPWADPVANAASATSRSQGARRPARTRAGHHGGWGADGRIAVLSPVRVAAPRDATRPRWPDLAIGLDSCLSCADNGHHLVPADDATVGVVPSCASRVIMSASWRDTTFSAQVVIEADHYRRWSSARNLAHGWHPLAARSCAKSPTQRSSRPEGSVSRMPELQHEIRVAAEVGGSPRDRRSRSSPDEHRRGGG